MKRLILSRKSIINRYSSKVELSVIDSVLKNPKIERYSHYDYNRVKHIIAYEDIVSDIKKNILTFIPTMNTTSSIDDSNNLFAIDYEKNKVYEVIEYSDED